MRRKVHACVLGVLALLASAGCGPTEVLVGDAPGVARVVAGVPGVTHEFGFVDSAVAGPAVEQPLGSPADVAALADGSFYFADRFRRRIGRVSGDGQLSWPVGRGICGAPGPVSDDPLEVCLGSPWALAIERDGTLIIADAGAHYVYRYDPVGERIERVFGVGLSGRAADGTPALNARTATPADVAIGPDGALYVAESENNRVVRVDLAAGGTVASFVGTGVPGDAGDGGAADSAQLTRPQGLVWIGDTLFVADGGNHRIRRVVGGTIGAFAGLGAPGYAGDGGGAAAALFRRPGRMAVIGALLLVADRDNFRVRVIRLGPDSIATFAGTGQAEVGADLLDVGRTPIAGPAGIAAAGRAVFIADSGGAVVRRVVR